MNTYAIKVADVISNINAIKKKAGSCEIIGVIKGNGYGFGMKYMASLLKTEGIKAFAVTEISDGVSLRKDALIDETILILRSTSIESEITEIVENGLTATIGSVSSALAVNAVAKEMNRKVKAHIAIDTGMRRYGFDTTKIDDAVSVLKECEWVEITGIYTHFSSAFRNAKLTASQLDHFKTAVQRINQSGIETKTVHCANTPALFNVKGVTDGMTAVRIGSGFTGRVVTKSKSGLLRAGTLRSNVIEMNDVPSGTDVGYNAGYRTKRQTTIGIVPVGHYDGFGVEKAEDVNSFGSMIHKILSTGKRFVTKERLWVKVDGKKYPVIGHIGLSHTAIDFTGSNVKIGDIAEIDISPLFANPTLPRVYE